MKMGLMRPMINFITLDRRSKNHLLTQKIQMKLLPWAIYFSTLMYPPTSIKKFLPLIWQKCRLGLMICFWTGTLQSSSMDSQLQTRMACCLLEKRQKRWQMWSYSVCGLILSLLSKGILELLTPFRFLSCQDRKSWQQKLLRQVLTLQRYWLPLQDAQPISSSANFLNQTLSGLKKQCSGIFMLGMQVSLSQGMSRLNFFSNFLSLDEVRTKQLWQSLEDCRICSSGYFQTSQLLIRLFRSSLGFRSMISSDYSEEESSFAVGALDFR